MDKEYVSIKEFAVRANISKQRVYQLLEKKLNPYCKTIENKKHIDISALEKFQKISSFENIAQPLENRLELTLKKSFEMFGNYNFQPLEKRLEISLNKNSETNENSNFQPIERTIENIIESFNKQLEIKDKQINELTKMLRDIQAKQDELMYSLKAAQALHAGTIQEHIESKIEKKGFWHWFFRKRN